MKPVLSIIVPTRNRSEYVLHLLKCVLTIEKHDFQIVIHDNSDTMELKNSIKPLLSDQRIKYSHTIRRLSFADTFNKAFLLSDGDYVAFVGDDDGVNPEIVEAARWAKEMDFDSLTPTRVITYGWPNFVMKRHRNFHNSRLIIRRFDGSTRLVVPSQELAKSTSRAFQDFFFLPRLYYGLVKRQLVQQVIDDFGSVFFGSAPDISGSVAITKSVNRAVTIDYPLFIVGSSAGSGAGRGGLGRHVGDLNKEPQTKDFAHNWPIQIPPMYSVQTVWAHAGLEALKSTGRDDMISRFNIALIHAKTLISNPPTFYSLVLRNLWQLFRKREIGVVSLIIRFPFYCLQQVIHNSSLFVWRGLRLGRWISYSHEETQLEDIGQATKALTQFLHSNGIRFSNTISYLCQSVPN